VNGAPCWFVLLIGGPSGIGKTTVAAQVAQRLGVPWLMVDDLRLALERSGVPVPDSQLVGTFDAPGGLVTVGELMTPAIEVVIENHVDQRIPVVIEGDGILPSLFERASVRARATEGRIRAVFLYEPDADALYANMQARRVGLFSQAHARKNFLYGKWLRQEAERRGLPTVAARPWHTLVDRILAASGLS
jgi:2-phosphoglycerate kinase